MRGVRQDGSDVGNGIVSPRWRAGINAESPHAGIAGTGDNGDYDPVAAILAVLAVVALWWVATHGKGGAALRLVAWGSALFVVWLLVAFKDPGVATGIATGFATGISQAAVELGKFLGQF